MSIEIVELLNYCKLFKKHWIRLIVHMIKIGHHFGFLFSDFH